VTNGTESFKEFFTRIFETDKKEPKKSQFAKQVKETKEYKEASAYIEETLSTAKHPKLRKLAELLEAFFKDPHHREKSKVIIFV
jgi:ERCC4-related helicase